MRLREIASYSSIMQEEVYPGPSLSGKEAIIDWLRNNMGYIFHAACTCTSSTSLPFRPLPNALLIETSPIRQNGSRGR